MRDHIRVSFFAVLCSVLSLCAQLQAKSEELATFSVEIADSTHELAWGLMGRKFLPPDGGMLFVFAKKDFQTLWSFNCYIDFSVAFLADDGEITQIADLRSYPEEMKDFPVLRTPEDLLKIDWSHPSIQFYREHSVRSKERVRYALEMRLGWFSQKGIKEGDYVEWDGRNRTGKVFREPT